MKKILFTLFAALFLLGMPQEAKASHAAGGEITYKYIGDSTGIPYHYCIYLTVYRRNESGSASLPATLSPQLQVTSGCFGTQSLSMPRTPPPPGRAAGDGGWTPLNYTSCVDENDPAGFNISEHRYQTCVVLPGKCSDFKFSWSLCCRNSNITNLVNPAGNNLYLESTLNNTLGPNTSGRFLNAAAKQFCVGTSFTWSQAAAEPDGDSLRYSKGQPWSGPNAPIQWAATYSTPQPMKTANGYNLDQKTGTFTFEPSQVEVDVLKVVVEEYRYDSTFSVWLQNGTAIREMQVPIVSQCNILAQQGLTIDTNLTGPGNIPANTSTFNTDSLREIYGITQIGNDSTASAGGYNVKIPGVPYFCYDSVVTIGFSTRLKCSTFSPNGSEFRIIGPDGVTRPVVGVNTKCGTDLLTDEVDLILHRPLDTNGLFLLYLKTGDDGDVLENECGFAVNPFYAIMIEVNDCPILDYRMLNTSVERDIDIRIDWEADNTTFSENVFTTWQILRANNDDQFYLHDNVDDVHARTYLDTTLSAELVDGSPFQYAVQLVQNYKAITPTNAIRSILLTQDNNGDSTSTFTWTAYDGFDNDTISASNDADSSTYEFEGGPVVGGTPQWENIWGPAANTGVYTNLYNWPDVAKGDSVVYAYRVLATEPQNPNNPFISESNWVYLEFKTPKDPPIIIPNEPVIPNVFTPNGDGMNDIFYIQSDYSNVSISIYNRWGKMVFEDIDAPQTDYDEGGKGWDGKDINSGNQLADGTYYYVIELSDEASGEKEQLKGHLNIFTSGTR
ncbi:hypothetical protein Oweho_2188 [Owenweeksia hongkongensis DSM 17368]|uniref:Gliding motility-associated C-terminal domain-containing protein n=1 Tax=Owenweeksia hongkongensis (strain DSM 17368 / CIP 108786 / JCM 12287 / NRRL B-23963 / UST20020801) TaxID=926562 RepID=G8R4N8_OWEHD|nr:gliding motility-associated C-terminal domain-containing protein [Owenweeksia hongkongensis]AEV33162.1 hypothetical protein Oweho_2188 [Owenweeksia hongkongensis DSM 17368]